MHQSSGFRAAFKYFLLLILTENCNYGLCHRIKFLNSAFAKELLYKDRIVTIY